MIISGELDGIIEKLKEWQKKYYENQIENFGILTTMGSDDFSNTILRDNIMKLPNVLEINAKASKELSDIILDGFIILNKK